MAGAVLEIDGSRHSGSGTIVRQAAAFSALTGRAVHVVNARVRRPQPGLRHQHVRVVEAIRDLVNGTAEGLAPGSREFWFKPGTIQTGRRYVWDIGTAGSTTMLGVALLPVLAFASAPVDIELRGGLFQDFAPSFFHVESVLMPLLRRMGFEAAVSMGRPGYVPRGEGVLSLSARPVSGSLCPLRLDRRRELRRIWGIALSSHLEQRRVSERMQQAAQDFLGARGYRAEIEIRHDRHALQPGAACALFADSDEGIRLGADRAGALRRSAESIGRHVAQQLLVDWHSGATLDRFATDQIVPFTALAEGQSRFRIPEVTDHLQTCAWLAELFCGAKITIDGQLLTIDGVGYQRGRPAVNKDSDGEQ
ncbi:MAG TPA: RNA 3'-terminal phosphate cyclase [Nitrospiraceae bacterium]|nr:RNA 3'-terminal phosphate cyclase [Nitrospiraceae bacterium]